MQFLLLNSMVRPLKGRPCEDNWNNNVFLTSQKVIKETENEDMNSYNPNEHCGCILKGNSSKFIVSSSTIIVNSEELNEFALIERHRLKLARAEGLMSYIMHRIR